MRACVVNTGQTREIEQDKKFFFAMFGIKQYFGLTLLIGALAQSRPITYINADGTYCINEFM